LSLHFSEKEGVGLRYYTYYWQTPDWLSSVTESLIYKNMKNISYLSDLAKELRNYPDFTLVFGLHPLQLPQVENFSVFLCVTDNGILLEMRISLVS